MAKKNQTLKEILQIVVFLIVVGVLLTVFVIYPLGETKEIMGRANLGDYNPDSLPVNDASAFVEAGLLADTVTIEVDVDTKLAGVYIRGTADSVGAADTTSAGLMILIHDERTDRNSLLPMAKYYAAKDFDVMLYDQRACGLTSGEYRSDGQLESEDLLIVLSHLEFHDQLSKPTFVYGSGLGAESALMAARASQDGARIDAVIAASPYLSTERWLDMMIAEHDVYWLPIRQSLLWFWFKTRSGYSLEFKETESVSGVACRTLVLGDADAMHSRAFELLAERSNEDLLTMKMWPESDTALMSAIDEFISTVQPPIE